MVPRRHAAIARLALERGFLDEAAYAAALEALSTRGAQADREALDVFWVGGGWLKEEELATVMSIAASPAATRVGFVGSSPLSGAAPSSSSAALSSSTAVLPGGTAAVAAPLPEGRPPLPARYDVQHLVGTGGMGDVYAARDRHLDRIVALKVPRTGSDERIARAIEREARVAGALEHPAIVPVYDAAAEGSAPFYAMRFLDQPTLEEVIARLASRDPDAQREYSLGRLLRYYVQICQAMHYAHARGVVHCDLKPANIAVGEFGEVLILDWGMAFKLEEGMRQRGGTPGYLAPEQVLPEATVDARADVFALGAILYEILCFEPAYGHGMTELVVKVAAGEAELPPPEPPSARRPGVPAELEGICLRAMARRPEERHASARELADDIEAFLEGTKEREQRQARAAAQLEQGEQLAEMYREYVESRPALVDEIARIRARTLAWEPAERKRELWDAEDRLAATDAVGVRTFQAAVAAYEQVLEDVPGHAEARRGLAQLYAIEVERARARRDELNRIYFEELVKQYSDGSAALARADGILRVRCEDGVGTVLLYEQEEQDRRLVPVRERRLGTTPLEVRLPPGHYLLRVGREPTRPLVQCPVSVAPSRDTVVEIDLAACDGVGPHERYVPAGIALLGGNELSVWGRELVPVHVGAFVISERPVTFAEYLAFLEDVVRGGEDVSAHVPVNASGAPYWRWNGELFVPVADFKLKRETFLALPAFGISLASAEAYAAWRLLKTGATFRLPREDEWEKAARGCDGRGYPWGDHFDASFCKMYQSRPGAPSPEPSGSFPADMSPYGVRDMAGGIAEWVAPAGRQTAGVDVARGGAWCDWQADCHLSARRPYPAGSRSSRVGFRLARDP